MNSEQDAANTGDALPDDKEYAPPSPKPATLPLKPEAIHAEIRKIKAWVGWRWKWLADNQRWTKEPINLSVGRGKYRASSTNPDTWTDFETAAAVYRKFRCDGIGCCVTDGWTYIDLDGVLQDGKLRADCPWAHDIFKTLTGRAYIEFSPSGTGLHLITRGQLPVGRRTQGFREPGQKVKAEMYDKGKYFTFTGHVFAGSAAPKVSTKRLAALHARLFPPSADKVNGKVNGKTNMDGLGSHKTMDDAELLERAHNAKNGDKFKRLFDEGDFSDYASQSEADLALCSMLAFWVGRDNGEQMDRLFRQSGLMRDKWDRNGYSLGTISKALDGQTEFYYDTVVEPDPVSTSTAAESPQENAEVSGDAEFDKPSGDTIQADGTAEQSPGVVKPKPEKPKVCVTAEKLDTVARETIRVLREANETIPKFFVQGHRMVHVVRDAKGRPGIAEVGDLFFLPELERVADFYAVKIEGTVSRRVPARPTQVLARTILARPQKEWGLPELRGVVMGPVLRQDGSIVSSRGYDPDLHLYFAPLGKLHLPPIPESPTKEDCREARSVIEDVIAEFPFVSQADRANYMALLLTPLLRYTVDDVPLALLDAPKMGTGKSLLAEVMALLHEGKRPSMWAAPSGSETWEKSLTTILLRGRAITIFDNVENTLQSPVLAKVLTSAEHSDRMMRTHTEMTIPNATMFVATGNNIRLGGDLSRRCYQIRLDAQIARPWQRKQFKYPFLKAHVRQNRPALLAALLTMARGWYRAGEPRLQTEELGGGFEKWSRLVGRILAFADVDGFLGNQEKLYEETDPSEKQWEQFLMSLKEKYPTGFTLGKFHKDLEEGTFPHDVLPEDDDLTKLTSAQLAGVLRRKRDTRFGPKNLYLSTATQKGKPAKWTVRKGAAN